MKKLYFKAFRVSSVTQGLHSFYHGNSFAVGTPAYTVGVEYSKDKGTKGFHAFLKEESARKWGTTHAGGYSFAIRRVRLAGRITKPELHYMYGRLVKASRMTIVQE